VATNDNPMMDRIRRAALGIGIACLALCGAGALVRPDIVSRGYLVAYCYVAGLALGSMAIVMVHHLTGGRWGVLARRVLESAASTMPALALLFLPILLGRDSLYPWTNESAVAADPVLRQKSLYLNVSAFSVRAAVYFAIWVFIASLLSRWSRQDDETGEPRVRARLRALSGPGLVLYGLTITFAAIDWVMSLEPRWFSTIFAVVFGVAQMLSAMAFAILTLSLLASRRALDGLASARTCRDLGNLLLTLVMFWTYTAFSQFLLIWAGNLPDEIAWYLPRFDGGWKWIALSVILLQFALPFVFLLFRRVKEDLSHLARVAVLILATCFVNMVWQIVPAFPPGGLVAHWLDVVAAIIALLGVGGVWLALFLGQLKRMPLVPLQAAASAEVAAHG